MTFIINEIGYENNKKIRKKQIDFSIKPYPQPPQKSV